MRQTTSQTDKAAKKANPFKNPRVSFSKRKHEAAVRRQALRVPEVIDTPEGTIEENRKEAAP